MAGAIVNAVNHSAAPWPRAIRRLRQDTPAYIRAAAGRRGRRRRRVRGRTVRSKLPRRIDRMPRSVSPVGVYDSGYGGLTVLRELRRTLPALDYIYLGDSGRAPYGGRDMNTILDFAEQCAERLFAEGCGSSWSRAILPVRRPPATPASLRRRRTAHPRRLTIPAAEAAVAQTRGRIGFIGTARTVASGTQQLGPHLTVLSVRPGSPHKLRREGSTSADRPGQYGSSGGSPGRSPEQQRG